MNQRAFETIAKPLCAEGVVRNAKECQIKMKTLKIEHKQASVCL